MDDRTNATLDGNTGDMDLPYYYYYYDNSYDYYVEFFQNPKNYLPKELPAGVKTAFIALFSLIMLMSLAGNSLVIIVVARHKKMRTVTNVFLVSLAISDILIAAVNMPIQLHWYLVNYEWTLGEPMCKFARYFQGVVIVVSILTLTGIALDRYYAICHPLRARLMHTITRAAILIGMFWTVSFLMLMPQLFIQRLEPILKIPENTSMIPETVFACVEYFTDWKYEMAYTFYIYIVLYLVPVFVMFGTYGRISVKLWKRQPIGETPDDPRESQRRLQEKKRIVRMLVVIVVLFVLSWFPFFTCHVYSLFREHGMHDQVFRVATAFFQLCGYSNCCINPIIYCFMNDSFQKRFYKTVCCCKCFWNELRRRRRMSSTDVNGLTPMVSTNLTATIPTDAFTDSPEKIPMCRQNTAVPMEKQLSITN